MENMLRTRGLARTFRTKQATVEAVRGVDLDVGAGEIVGFLGPNGAGKTTTLRMLTTLLAPTAGEATVAGCDLRRAPADVRRRIGYVAQSGGVDPTLPVSEELVTQGEFYGLTGTEARRRAAALAERFGLAEVMKRQGMTLSGGQRRRMDLALGLVHRPRLLFLDEPSTGLDPAGRAGLWDHIRSVRAEDGMTVFCTTHYLDEADALCDRVLIIDDGAIIAEGAPEELKRKLSGDAIVVDLHPGDGEDTEETAAAALRGRAEVTSVTAEPPDPPEDGGVRLRVAVASGDRALSGVVLALDAAGVRPAAVHLARPTLDDVFLALTGRRSEA
jgi:ABC-2 type transport system ATP-binding protein